MLGEFLAWTWITTQGEPFNIKALVVIFPLFSNNIYVHVLFSLTFLDQLSRLLLDLLLVLACFVVS